MKKTNRKRNPWINPLTHPDEVVDRLAGWGIEHEDIHFTDSDFAPSCFLRKDTVKQLLDQLDLLGVLDYEPYTRRKRPTRSKKR